jgi:hypothetical protein
MNNNEKSHNEHIQVDKVNIEGKVFSSAYNSLPVYCSPRQITVNAYGFLNNKMRLQMNIVVEIPAFALVSYVRVRRYKYHTSNPVSHFKLSHARLLLPLLYN